ncbi:MAG: 1,2-dihydroxy-3-keto-5-methylthiopentene dioxygenase [Vampirovibrionia bacterium]
MTLLKIFDEAANLICESEDLEFIQNSLGSSGVSIEHWDSPPVEDFSDAEVLKFYENEIEKIKNNYGFKAVDLMSVNPELVHREDFPVIRNKFLKEHTHADDEVRYFISGSGLFTIHHLDRVYSILCSAGDFIRVPANTWHWFDMGLMPQFKCLRFFSDESGWIPCYHEESISHRFDLDPKSLA